MISYFLSDYGMWCKGQGGGTIVFSRVGPEIRQCRITRLSGKKKPHIRQYPARKIRIIRPDIRYPAKKNNSGPTLLFFYLRVQFSVIYCLFQVETVKDCFVGVSGAPEKCKNHAEKIMDMAMDMRDCVQFVPDPRPASRTTSKSGLKIDL